MNRDDISRDWRGTVLSDLAWRRASVQPPVDEGDLRGFAVVAPGFRGRGFLKPGVLVAGSEHKHFAAREKIAADLAFDLSLPVPPAVLWRRAGAPEPRVVISLFVYPQDVKWFLVEYAGVRPLGLSDQAAAVALRVASGMLAFDTWVDQHEHAAHRPGNLVWGFDPATGASGISFLDYASAFGADGSWSSGASSIEGPLWPGLLLRHLDHRRLRDVVDAIEDFAPERIAEIVHRVPADFLPEPEKNMLELALVRRRALVRSALATHLQEDAS